MLASLLAGGGETDSINSNQVFPAGNNWSELMLASLLAGGGRDGQHQLQPGVPGWKQLVRVDAGLSLGGGGERPDSINSNQVFPAGNSWSELMLAGLALRSNLRAASRQ